MTRVLIADDEPLARERLKMLLDGQEGEHAHEGSVPVGGTPAGGASRRASR